MVGNRAIERRVAERTATFVHDVESGVPVHQALDTSYEACANPEIVRVATDMLAATGEVDMKQLAVKVGMSRAALYRRYPDRRQLESEIGAKGAAGMLAAASPFTGRGDRLRAHAEYLIDHPGEAVAIIRLAAGSSIAVLRAAAVALSGSAADTTWTLGFAVIAAMPGRDDEDIAAMKAYLDEMVAELD